MLGWTVWDKILDGIQQSVGKLHGLGLRYNHIESPFLALLECSSFVLKLLARQYFSHPLVWWHRKPPCIGMLLGLCSAPMTPQEIKDARKALGLTQAQLAQVMGMNGASYVSRLENGAQQMGGASERLLRAYLEGYRPKDWPE